MTNQNNHEFIKLIIEKLNSSNSTFKTGETRVQKALYVAQEIMNISLGYKFYLYRYGPYCDEISNDLSVMTDQKIIGRTIEPSGVSYYLNDNSENNSEYDSDDKKINEIVERFKDKNVQHLEELSTACWVVKNYNEDGIWSTKIRELKPRIETSKIPNLIEDAKSLKEFG